MDIKPLTSGLSVSGQIKHGDVSKIAALGFKTIINNRPDCEVSFQPRTKSLAACAKRAGIDYIYLPIVSGQVTQKDIEDFSAVLAKADGPVFAFCRTGKRSANLWAKANSDNLPASEITRIGTLGGYSL